MIDDPSKKAIWGSLGFGGVPSTLCLLRTSRKLCILMSRALLTSLLLVMLSSCVSLPSERPARGLYRDLRQAVEFREGNSWIVDRLEIEQAAPGVMRSICSTPHESSRRLQTWLTAEIDRSGGPSESQFQASGEVDSVIRETRRLERVRALLDAAEENRADCPYWLEAEARFAGVQGDEGRFAVWLESGGGGSLNIGHGGTQLGGGGTARIMPAIGLGKRLTLAVGFGVGASGVVPESEDGTREFRGVISTLVPLVLRVADISRVYDLELSMSSRYIGSDIYHGARVGLGVGLSAPRVAGLMPYALIWTGYEFTPPQYGSPEQHTLWLGSRVGFDWTP